MVWDHLGGGFPSLDCAPGLRLRWGLGNGLPKGFTRFDPCGLLVVRRLVWGFVVEVVAGSLEHSAVRGLVHIRVAVGEEVLRYGGLSMRGMSDLILGIVGLGSVGQGFEAAIFGFRCGHVMVGMVRTFL